MLEKKGNYWYRRREGNMDFTKIYTSMKEFLQENQIKTNEPMKKHTSFRIGGPAEIMVFPTNPEEICSIIKICKQDNIPFFVMGNGTNLLVKDKGIKGVVLKLAQNYNDAQVDKNIIKCKLACHCLQQLK